MGIYDTMQYILFYIFVYNIIIIIVILSLFSCYKTQSSSIIVMALFDTFVPACLRLALCLTKPILSQVKAVSLLFELMRILLHTIRWCWIAPKLCFVSYVWEELACWNPQLF